jgi:hypothetical protein
MLAIKNKRGWAAYMLFPKANQKAAATMPSAIGIHG